MTNRLSEKKYRRKDRQKKNTKTIKHNCNFDLREDDKTVEAKDDLEYRINLFLLT